MIFGIESGEHPPVHDFPINSIRQQLESLIKSNGLPKHLLPGGLQQLTLRTQAPNGIEMFSH